MGDAQGKGGSQMHSQPRALALRLSAAAAVAATASITMAAGAPLSGLSQPPALAEGLADPGRELRGPACAFSSFGFPSISTHHNFLEVLFNHMLTLVCV